MFPKKLKSVLIFLAIFLAVFGMVKFVIWDSKTSKNKKHLVAIEGHDVIAFHKEGRAVKGIRKYSYRWNQSTWYFKNDDFRQIFISNPDKYAPRYGGNCSFTTSIGKAQRGLAKYWEIREGKLYLNSNLVSYFMWKHLPGREKKADAHWKRMTAK